MEEFVSPERHPVSFMGVPYGGQMCLATGTAQEAPEGSLSALAQPALLGTFWNQQDSEASTTKILLATKPSRHKEMVCRL